MNKSKIIPTIKKWLLMISMSLGIGGYFLILSLNLGQETNHQIATVVTNMLPYLLFVMLFLEFSKIEPRDLFPKKWLWNQCRTESRTEKHYPWHLDGDDIP